MHGGYREQEVVTSISQGRAHKTEIFITTDADNPDLTIVGETKNIVAMWMEPVKTVRTEKAAQRQT
jgi:hypothetical protein